LPDFFDERRLRRSTKQSCFLTAALATVNSQFQTVGFINAISHHRSASQAGAPEVQERQVSKLPNPFETMTYVPTQRAAVDAKVAEVETVLRNFKAAVTRSLPKLAKKPAKRRGK
jgi:hypothetical protein